MTEGLAAQSNAMSPGFLKGQRGLDCMHLKDVIQES